MNTQFRRILDLIKRTGDRMVVTDPDGEDVFVVMDLNQYEDLLAMDEDFDDEWFQDDLSLNHSADGSLDSSQNIPEPWFGSEPETDGGKLQNFSVDEFEPKLVSEPALETKERQVSGAAAQESMATREQIKHIDSPETPESLQEQDSEELPHDIHEAVKHDLKIIEEISDKNSLNSEEKSDDDDIDEERFYLEPIE